MKNQGRIVRALGSCLVKLLILTKNVAGFISKSYSFYATILLD
jgi:hypothetical protein